MKLVTFLILYSLVGKLYCYPYWNVHQTLHLKEIFSELLPVKYIYIYIYILNCELSST